MTFAKSLFPGRRKQAEIEAEQLTREVLERARLALRQQPTGPVRPPVTTRILSSARSRPTAQAMRYPSLLQTYPEPLIILMCLSICAVELIRSQWG